MANRVAFPQINQAFDANGDPIGLAEASFFMSGTSTPETVYSDDALTTAHPSPLVADASGVFAAVFVASGIQLKVDVIDPGTLVSLPGYPADPVVGSPSSTSDAIEVAFTPSPSISSVNVQAAIEEVQGNIDVATQAPDALKQYLTGGTSTAYTLTPSPAVLTLSTGMVFTAIMHAECGVSPVMNVNTLGNKKLYYYDGSASLVQPVAGNLRQGVICSMEYDSTLDGGSGGFVVRYGVYASQTEAEAGAESGILMDAERVYQAISSQSQKIAVFTEQQPSGTNGGTKNAATWDTRSLNTVVYNNITGASLSSGDFILPEGTYHIWAEAVQYDCGAAMIRIHNQTDATTERAGLTPMSSPSHDGASVATLWHVLVVSGGSKTFRLQHYTAAAQVTVGKGSDLGSGTDNTYAQVVARKIG